MELPELFLAPSRSRLTPECTSSESSDLNSSLKRKAISDSFLERKSSHTHRNIIDLQHSNERLPLDWEQCLDLESGKIYFLNRKTLKKSWDRPTSKDQYHQYNSQRLDLELYISSNPKTAALVATSKFLSLKEADLTTVPAQQVTRKDNHRLSVSSTTISNYSNKKDETKMISSNDNMVAMACMNCHMLVIVSKSSPTCPNCKFVHSITPTAAQQISPSSVPRKATTTFKPIDTLSLFS